MDETLKPCPFCGGSWVITHRPANGSQPYISCKECNASGPLTAGMTEAQWRAAWGALTEAQWRAAWGAFYYGDGWTETPLYKLEGFR